MGAFELPLRYAASKWETIFWSQWEAAKTKRGAVPSQHALDNTIRGTLTPRVTNAEAVALVVAWKAKADAHLGGWSLWYQFAAVGYGWSVTSDKLVITAPQAAKLYALDTTTELWLALQRIALALDGINAPTMQLNAQSFADPVFQARVRKSLREDGATASWVIGFGGCTDPKTGKPAPPQVKCEPTGVPGVLKCTYKCVPRPISIDPMRGVREKFFTTAVMVVAVWWILSDGKTRRGRRKTR